MLIRPLARSEQQIVDCPGPEYGLGGCDGGHSGHALDYIHNHGVVEDNAYPYTASRGQCRMEGGVLVNGYYNLQDCGSLEEAVSQEARFSRSQR